MTKHKRSFFEQFLKPSSQGEWITLILIVVLSIAVLVFLFFGYTHWRFM